MFRPFRWQWNKVSAKILTDCLAIRVNMRLKEIAHDINPFTSSTHRAPITLRAAGVPHDIDRCHRGQLSTQV